MLRGDPNPQVGDPSRTLFVLDAGDGRRFELDLSAAALPAGSVNSMLNKQ